MTPRSLALLLAICPAAFPAQMISNISPFGVFLVDPRFSDSSGVLVNHLAQLTRFNPALGTLTSVDLT